MPPPFSPHQGNFPPQFQPPPNIPNVDFSAPVIRLGTTGPGRSDGPPGGRGGGGSDFQGGRRGVGLGFDGRDRDRGGQQRDIQLHPPTREEIARTIFVGNITEGCGGDEGVHTMLSMGGGLRRWTRCFDADGKPCNFGFAEYEDADSLGIAIEIFKNVEVPTRRRKPGQQKKEDVKQESDDIKPEEVDIKAEEEGDKDDLGTSVLQVVVDPNSQSYVEEWRARGSMRDPEEAESRINQAKSDLDQFITVLRNSEHNAASAYPEQEGDRVTADDIALGDGTFIPVAGEDELSDIPAEMRETVAKEIASFRDRSIQRDKERLKREEELEAAQRRQENGWKVNRLASPPRGPRAEQEGRGQPGSQPPKGFVAGANGDRRAFAYTIEEQESDASDDELERRRVQKKEAEEDREFQAAEKKWLQRERMRFQAAEREDERDRAEKTNLQKHKDEVARRLKQWDDDAESTRKAEEYYRDKSAWLRARADFRAREAQLDSQDRAQEERENAQTQERSSRMADQFLESYAEELDARAAAAPEPTRFTMSLGAAAQKAQAAAAPKHTIAEVEGLLEYEEDEEDNTAKRSLRPIMDLKDDKAGRQAEPLSEADRAEAARQLAKDIPTDKEGLWTWPVSWDYVDAAMITEKLRPFVARKIVEYLGVEEPMLGDIVEETIKSKGDPQKLVSELEGVSRAFCPFF